MSEVITKRFPELNIGELYDILQLRSAIFVVEQKCAYQDCDDYDKAALHLVMMDNHKLIAYARILPPHSKYPQTSIGRVAVHPDWRGKNLARKLIETAIAEAKKAFPGEPLMVQAQHYLEKFYESFGFRTFVDIYDEDGIPHVDMVMA